MYTSLHNVNLLTFQGYVVAYIFQIDSISLFIVGRVVTITRLIK